MSFCRCLIKCSTHSSDRTHVLNALLPLALIRSSYIKILPFIQPNDYSEAVQVLSCSLSYKDKYEMITNLFSMFDPRCGILGIRWLVLLIPTFMVGVKFSQRAIGGISSMLGAFSNFLVGEIKSARIGTPFSSGRTLMFIRLFVYIMCRNFIALFPFVFTSTAQIILSFPLALIMWTSFILFGWFNNVVHILAHALPLGTPTPLMVFIVCIELIRNIIRPITLRVRLRANIIAGHLLLCLLGSTMIALRGLAFMGGMVLPLALCLLEMAVAVIQGYVFITLGILYFNEVV